MIPLIYVLEDEFSTPSADSVLAAVAALDGVFETRVFAPSAMAAEVGAHARVGVTTFAGVAELSRLLRPVMSASRSLAFVSTDPRHSFAMIMLNALYRRRVNHFHFVRDAAGDNADGGLRKFDVRFIAESPDARRRLIGRGIGRERIFLADRFMSERRRAEIGARGAFASNGVRRVAVAGDAAGIEMLSAAVASAPLLNHLEFRVFPSTAIVPAAAPANVRAADAATPWCAPGRWDMFLCLGSWLNARSEVLDALAAGVPVMTGEAAAESSVISDNINGFCFRAGDASALAERLTTVARLSHSRLNAVVKGGKSLLNIRFSAEKGIERYRRLFSPAEMPVIEINGGKLIL